MNARHSRYALAELSSSEFLLLIDLDQSSLVIGHGDAVDIIFLLIAYLTFDKLTDQQDVDELARDLSRGRVWICCRSNTTPWNEQI